MLDSIQPWGRPIHPFLPKGVHAAPAQAEWEIREYFRVRAQIFAEEQGLFEVSDRDEYDEIATPIVALAQVAGVGHEVVGVVRIYSPEDGVYYGGRLGVSHDYRRVGAIGTALIACAVSTAHARGAQRFFATVQERNVKYFERHHFARRRAISVCGSPHQLMEADLMVYPPKISQAYLPGKIARQSAA